METVTPRGERFRDWWPLTVPVLVVLLWSALIQQQLVGHRDRLVGLEAQTREAERRLRDVSRRLQTLENKPPQPNRP